MFFGRTLTFHHDVQIHAGQGIWPNNKKFNLMQAGLNTYTDMGGFCLIQMMVCALDLRVKFKRIPQKCSSKLRSVQKFDAANEKLFIKHTALHYVRTNQICSIGNNFENFEKSEHRTQCFYVENVSMKAWPSVVSLYIDTHGAYSLMRLAYPISIW